MHNLENGTQSQDSENAQRNLEIVQIPRLRGTYILVSATVEMVPLRELLAKYYWSFSGTQVYLHFQL